MLKVSVISKVKKGQRIVNYKIKTDDGRVALVDADDFKKYIANGSVYVHNMTLTSDGKQDTPEYFNSMPDKNFGLHDDCDIENGVYIIRNDKDQLI